MESRTGATLKSWRPLAGNAEAAFQRQAGAPYLALVEQPADQGDAMRHTPRRRKFGWRVSRIGRPIAARLRDLDEARAQGERGMARSVGDGKHLVAQRGNQKQVDLGEEAPHLVGDFAPEAIG